MTRIFISHSSKDVDFVLKHLKPLFDGLGHAVWCSATDVSPAADWEQQIRAALAASDWFFVVLSPDAVTSEWVQAETHWALEKMRGRVVPVMIRRCDPTDAHIRLGTLQHLDFVADPIGAQSRLLALIQGRVTRLPTNVRRPNADEVPERTTIISTRRRCLLLFAAQSADGEPDERSTEIHSWAIIGRAVDADICIDDDCVSRKHARLAVIPAKERFTLMLTDLESANGTFVNGEAVVSDHPIQVGDRIEIGNSRLHIRAINGTSGD
jgi:hypothetical protein